MKKKGILILLVLMLMVVIGCKAESQPQEEVPQATESNQVEQSAPIESDEPAEPSGKVELMAVTLPKASQEDLLNYFQIAYESSQISPDLGSDCELAQLHIFFDVDPEFEKPADLDAQYLAWRDANHPEEPATPVPASNPQTQPSNSNQAQPVSNQTGPSGATIVNDPGWQPPSDDILANGGQRADFSQAKTAEEWGYKPSDPKDIIYGGGN